MTTHFASMAIQHILQTFICPFREANLTDPEKAWNKSMSEIRISVEWIFADIINSFKFLDFKKNLNIKLSAVGKMYITCSLFHNPTAIM
jgi:hypothetical protein